MKRAFILFAIAIFLFPSLAKADEGMWIPMFVKRLNYTDMQKLGCKLTPEEIYSVNNSSLKDAIVQFGGGCTGEIISSQGLILTNHHCGLGQIQEHSSVEHDYLTDGFWSMNKNEELTNPGLSVKFLVRMEDVSRLINDSLESNQLSEDERAKIIRRISKRLEKEAIKDTHYDARIKSFFGGNEFYLFVYETFTDVRLVATPPWGIGKYGADTDNWMWPRHKGDFCLFRVYTGADGKPAEYSTDNIPLKPKHHLPVSLGGVKKGDYAMIMGYPGRTNRYLTSKGVEMELNELAPAIVDVRTKKLDIYRAAMDADDDVRIKYASKQASTSNYWKYSIGEIKQLKQNKVVAKKMKLEAEFTDWVNRNQKRRDIYGNALKDIETAYQTLSKYAKADKYFMESIYQGSEIVALAYSLKGINSLYEKKVENPDEYKASLKAKVEKHFKDYDLPTDKKLFSAMLSKYYENVDRELQPVGFLKIAHKYKGDFDNYAVRVFKKSVFADKKELLELIESPKSINKDPAYKLMQMFINNYIESQKKQPEAHALLNKGNRLFIAGLREMQTDKTFYPDANFTMRLSYGTVEDYYPRDAVHFDEFTTLKGVVAKQIPGNWEFDLPNRMNELYETKNYGRYGDEDGTMKVNFITTNDITGGNSGSPVLDGEGNLIGLAFDGNWEAMSGDISFEQSVQRTICVDIRYVLFVIDKFAGAKHLVDEMTLVNTK